MIRRLSAAAAGRFDAALGPASEQRRPTFGIAARMTAGIGNGGDRFAFTIHDVMRMLLLFSLALPACAWPAEELDPEFWEHYEPYRQYSSATMEDLGTLDEGDLLATSRGTDGTVVRVLGRSSASSKLISARIALDSVARLRMVVKVARYESIVGVRRRLEVHRVQISVDQAEHLLDLLEKWRFWDAPYTLDRAPGDDAFAAVCTDTLGWLLEGVTPRAYQIMFRSNCDGLDPAAAEIRDFLLGLVNVSADGGD